MTFAQCDQQQNDQRLTRNLAVCRFLLLLLCLATISSTGCRMTTRFADTYRKKGYPEKAFEGYRDHVWAKRAYNLRYGNCNISNEEDFRAGFIEGYCDMCEGGEGTAPAIPPNEYWGHRYQSENGKQAIQSWFKGFPEGVRAAKQDGAGKHRKIFISNEMKAALDLQKKKSSTTLTARDLKPTESTPPASMAQMPLPETSEMENAKSILVTKPDHGTPAARTAGLPKFMRRARNGYRWSQSGTPSWRTANSASETQPSPNMPLPSQPMPQPVPVTVEGANGQMPSVMPHWGNAAPTTPTSSPLMPMNQVPHVSQALPKIVSPDQLQQPSIQPIAPMPQGLVPIVKPGDLLPGAQLDDQSSHQALPKQDHRAPELFQVMPASWNSSDQAKK